MHVLDLELQEIQILQQELIMLLVEVLWTLIPCLILIVMAVPSFKDFIQTRHNSKSRCYC